MTRSAPLSESERRALIAERQKKSAFWAIVHILGSLRLAMVLLFTIATAIAIATFTESRFDTAVARHYFYRAPWFSAWLIVLCINLACAALSRWPWQRKHLGFVITHGGIILLLIGAMAGRLNGFEAFLTLRKDLPQQRLIVQETILTFQSARDGSLDQFPFPVEVVPPSERNPRWVKMRDTQLELKVDGFTPQLTEQKELVASAEPSAPAGISLEFHSGMMGQSVPVTLLIAPEQASSFDFFGLARVSWMAKLPSPEKKKSEPTEIETHVVLALAPDQPVIHSAAKQPTGYRVFLGAEPSTATSSSPQFVVILRGPNGSEQNWPLASVKGKKITLADGASQMLVADFWPDFAMRNGKPVSLSKEPNNPAILAHLQIVPNAAAHAKPTLTLAPAGPGQASYQVTKQGKITSQGSLKVGDTIALGWADWQVTARAVEPHAEIRGHLVPAPATVADSDQPMANQSAMGKGDDAIPGIHARLVAPDGRESAPRWILSGTSQILVLDKEVIRIGFGLKPIALPFTVTLENFEVPRDEGTQTPANFISSLRFDDPKMPEPRRDVAQMNYPAMHPGGFWRSLLGWNYKFSQAQWNPENLNETTLQVLYDPGWPLKWVGSLMICVGIAVMFYFRPARSTPGPATN